MDRSDRRSVWRRVVAKLDGAWRDYDYARRRLHELNRVRGWEPMHWEATADGWRLVGLVIPD